MISDIPIEELLKDLGDSHEDLALAMVAKKMGAPLKTHSAEERIEGNKHFIEVITKEIVRRVKGGTDDST